MLARVLHKSRLIKAHNGLIATLLYELDTLVSVGIDDLLLKLEW